MRFFKWLLTLIFTLVIVLCIGGYWFIRNFDLNQYKPYVENLVAEQLGRKLEIKGDASIGISLIPTIIINDVTLTNPNWAKNPYMAKVDSVELKFSILPLLDKKVVIDKAILNNPEIYLETSKNGQNSWDFDIAPISTLLPVKVSSGGWLISNAYAEELPQSSNEVLDFLSDFTAEEISINNGLLQYYEQKSNNTTVLKITSLNFSTDSMNSPILLDWNVNYDNMPISGAATIGSINNIFDTKSALPVDAKLQALGMSANVNGSIWDIMGDVRLDAKVNLYNPSGNLNAPETTLISDVKADLNNIALDISSLNIVNNVITGTLKVNIAGKTPFITANLKSNSLNLQAFNQQRPTAFMQSFVSNAYASEMVPNQPIPFDLLYMVNGDFKLSVKNLIISPAAIAKNVLLTAKLNSGNLNISKLTLNFGNGDIDIKADVNAKTKQLNLKLNSNNVLIQDLHKEFVVENNNDFGFLSGGATQIYADLSGKGNTYRQMVDSFSGQMIAVVDKSEVQSGSLQFMTNNFITQILSVLKIEQKKAAKIDLKCAVVHADFRDGKMYFPKGIAIDSDKLTLVSDGNINLVNDKLNLNLNAYGSGLGDVGVMQALSNLVKIKGTMQSPKIMLDTEGAIKTIASAVAVPGIGPMVVGGQMILDRDASPCYTATQGTIYANRFEKPQGVVPTARTGYKDAKKVVNDSIGLIKSSTKDAGNLFKNLLKKGIE